MPRLCFCRLLLAVVCLMTVGGIVRAEEKIDLTPRDAAAARIEHIISELEVGGHLLVTPDATEPKSEDETIRKLPLSVHATIDYDQWRVPMELAGDLLNDSADAQLAMRRYEKAEAVIKVDDGGHQPTLPADRRVLLVRRLPGHRVTFSCPLGPLEREQLDLVDVVGDSLAVRDLLPTKPLDQSQSWKQDAAVMAAFLGLDEVAVCEVESIIEKAGSKYVQVRLAGAVHGTIDGAATEIELQGVYLFDRRERTITNLNLAVKEKRSIGQATPGLDVVAKLKLTVSPQSRADALGKSQLAELVSSGVKFEESLIYHGRRQGLRVKYDPNWFVTGEDREAVTFRRLDQGDLVAHCTIARLPDSPPDELPPLEQFQKEVQFSLRDNFGEFVKAREWTTRLGNRCYGVEARGNVQEIPVQWRYYLLATESGERATLAFTIEGRMVERLADADRRLVEDLELVPPEAVETPPTVARDPEPVPTAGAAEASEGNQNRSRAPRRVSRRRGGMRLR